MNQQHASQSIGVIGLGDMGTPMARNLVDSGYPVFGYDLSAEAMDRLKSNGGTPANSPEEIVERCDIILTSLPSSSTFLAVAKDSLLPNCRPGQLFIETGTTVRASFVDLVSKFQSCGAILIDSPVSGGVGGVEKRKLKMFVGASEETFAQVRPLLAAIGGDSTIYHCGGPGQGQAMKAVNQLKMAFENAAYLEILAYADRAGLDLDLITQIWSDRIASVAQRIIDGKGTNIGVKFRELPYFLEDAEALHMELPMTQALHQFCAAGDFAFFDDHRKAPSFWHELTKENPTQPPARKV